MVVMEESLYRAAVEGNISSLYELLLGSSSDPPSTTPLHIAASLGHTYFCLEFMIIRQQVQPSCARMLNKDGLSPMHLSLENGHFDTVRGMLAMDNELVRVKGKGGMTPLHCAVVDEARIQILKEMLSACPDSVKDLTIRKETALHLAVKYNRHKSFKALVESINFTDTKEIFEWKDEAGYTVLHLMVLRRQLKMIKWLSQYYFDVGSLFGIDIKDGNGKTVADILKEQRRQLHNGTAAADDSKSINVAITNSLYGSCKSVRRVQSILHSMLIDIRSVLGKYGGRPIVQTVDYTVYKFSKLTKGDARNALLVVATLIASATFQAGANPSPPDSPPDLPTDSKGLVQYFIDPADLVLPILMRVLNLVAFWFSVLMIQMLTMTFPLRNLIALSLFFMTTILLSSIFDNKYTALTVATAFWPTTLFWPVAVNAFGPQMRLADDDDDDHDEADKQPVQLASVPLSQV